MGEKVEEQRGETQELRDKVEELSKKFETYRMELNENILAEAKAIECLIERMEKGEDIGEIAKDLKETRKQMEPIFEKKV